MFSTFNRRALVGGWLAALITVAAVGVFSGVTVTLGTSALWLVTCLAPPVLLMTLWRDTPPTVAEVLNATERRG